MYKGSYKRNQCPAYRCGFRRSAALSFRRASRELAGHWKLMVVVVVNFRTAAVRPPSSGVFVFVGRNNAHFWRHSWQISGPHNQIVFSARNKVWVSKRNLQHYDRTGLLRSITLRCGNFGAGGKCFKRLNRFTARKSIFTANNNRAVIITTPICGPGVLFTVPTCAVILPLFTTKVPTAVGLVPTRIRKHVTHSAVSFIWLWDWLASRLLFTTRPQYTFTV